MDLKEFFDRDGAERLCGWIECYDLIFFDGEEPGQFEYCGDCAWQKFCLEKRRDHLKGKLFQLKKERLLESTINLNKCC